MIRFAIDACSWQSLVRSDIPSIPNLRHVGSQLENVGAGTSLLRRSLLRRHGTIGRDWVTECWWRLGWRRPRGVHANDSINRRPGNAAIHSNGQWTDPSSHDGTTNASGYRWFLNLRGRSVVKGHQRRGYDVRPEMKCI